MSETTEAKGPTSQKLHQVKYLGKTSVSKHCSSVVVPWVIEELRLKKKSYEEGGACWFTTGLDNISVVKEDGQQLLKCLHKDVVSSNTSPDSVSFALVVKEEEDECAFCHGFSPSNAAVVSCLALLLCTLFGSSFLHRADRRYVIFLMQSTNPLTKRDSNHFGCIPHANGWAPTHV